MAKDALNCLSEYVKATRNLESVMSSLIREGLQSENWRLRHQSLQSVTPLIRLDLSYTANEFEMKKVLERVLELIKDDSSLVVESAKEISTELKNLCYDFQTVFSKMTPGYKKLFDENCYTDSPLKCNFPNKSLPQNYSIFKKPERRQSTFAFQASIGELASSLSVPKDLYSESSKNGMVFGLIPVELMTQLEDSANWRARVNAIQELENIVASKEDFTEVFPYMAIFFRLLNKLLDDKNFKVVLSTLNIIQDIASISGISQKANVAQIVPLCLKKLGDNKITIRQSAFKVFKVFIQQMKPKVLFPQLLDALESTNWHIREEVVAVLITAMLTIEESYNYDFISFVPHLAKLLDDSKSKIRFVATEALAVCVHKCGLDKVNETLEPIIDEKAFSGLQERFKHKALPKLKEVCLEFPRSIPSSAPIISSPYISVTEFPKTQNLVSTETKAAELNYSRSTRDNSQSPQSSRFQFRARPSSQSSDDGVKPRVAIHSPSTDITSRKSFGTSLKPKVHPRPLSNRPPVAPTKFSYSGKYQLRNQDKFLTPVENSSRRFLSAEREQITNSHSSPSLVNKPAKQENETYLTYNELEAVENPEEALQNLLGSARSSDWSVNFESLNLIRKLLKHHPGVFLSQVTLHNLALDIVRWADSLRSSLCKNALITIGELARALGRTVDSEVQDLVKILMKKVVDTNVFISAQAEESLTSICRYCTENRVVGALLSNTQNVRNPITKAKAAFCFAKIFEKAKHSVGKLKDISKVVKLLGDYVSDASPEVRNSARSAFTILMNSLQSGQDFERLLKTSLSDIQFKKVKTSIESSEGLQPLRRKMQTGFRTTYPSNKKPKDRSFTKSAETGELSELNKLSETIMSNDWKNRYDALGSLLNIVNEQSVALQKSSSMIKVIDILSTCLNDKNLKVQIHGLSTFLKIIPVLNRSLEPHLGIICSSVLSGLGSSNSSIRDMAGDVIKQLTKHCGAVALLPSLAQEIPNSNYRSKPTLVSSICELVPYVQAKRPSLVHKHVVTLAYKLLGDLKAQHNPEVAKLVLKLYEVVGAGLLENAPASKLEAIMDILNEGM